MRIIAITFVLIARIIGQASAIKCYIGTGTDASKWEQADCTTRCFYADDNSRGCAADNKVGCKEVKNGNAVKYQCNCNTALCNGKSFSSVKCQNGEGDDKAKWTSVDCKGACSYKKKYDKGTVTTERSCGEPSDDLGWHGITGNSLEHFCASDYCNGESVESTLPTVYKCYKGEFTDELRTMHYCTSCTVSVQNIDLRDCIKVRADPPPVVLGCNQINCVCTGDLCNAPVEKNDIPSLGCHIGFGPVGAIRNSKATGSCPACQKRKIKYSKTGSVVIDMSCSSLNPDRSGTAGAIGCNDVTISRDVTATICNCRDKDLCNSALTATFGFTVPLLSGIVCIWMIL